MQSTSIEWTDSTWNPVRGCSEVSPGCRRCYAREFAERFRGVVGHPFEQGFDVRLTPDKLEEPFHWHKSKLIFANSMSDLFHESIPTQYIEDIVRVMSQANWHTYQVLTKRAGRLEELLKTTLRPYRDQPHIWWGVSVEDRKHGLPRIDHLRSAAPRMRMLSVEPLLEDLGRVDFQGIDWVIAGGESGNGAKPVDAKWIRSLRRQCKRDKVPFFFKQWGGQRKWETGRELDGKTYDAMPERAVVPRPSTARILEYIAQTRVIAEDWFAASDDADKEMARLDRVLRSGTDGKEERKRRVPLPIIQR